MQRKRIILFFSGVVCLLLAGGCTTKTISPGGTDSASGDTVAEKISATSSTVPNDSSNSIVKTVEGNSSSKSDHISNSEVKVFRNDPPLSGYGYDILVNGKVYVHQPNIPAVQGNRGFSTEQAARKTASLVAFKIKNKILPPSIEVRELDSMGVLK